MIQINEDKYKANYNLLLNYIKNGEVIPIVGNELFSLKYTEDNQNKEISIENFLAKELAKKYNLNYSEKKLSQVANEVRELKFDVYKGLREIYEKIHTNKYPNYSLNDENLNLLTQIKGFKTFLSVSYTDFLQKSLEKNRGKDKVITIDCYMAKSGESDSLDVICSEENFSDENIVIINLLGAINSKREFAITEEEYLEYLFNIIAGPKALILNNNYLTRRVPKESYFIYLGCEYPIWYTRYIVRGLTQRRFQRHMRLDNVFIDLPPMNQVDKEFLKQYNSFILDSTYFPKSNDQDITFENNITNLFLKNIHIDIGALEEIETQYLGLVFISYYSGVSSQFENGNIEKKTNKAYEIENLLRYSGINSWLDTRDLISGEHQIEIHKKIKESEIFLAVISKDLLDKIEEIGRMKNQDEIQKNTPYSVKIEWPFAEGKFRSKNYQDINFTIIPYLEDKIARTDKRIPEFMRGLTIYHWSEQAKLIETIKLLLKKKE